jgi:GDSL-like Lipase/Acylhydrolase family
MTKHHKKTIATALFLAALMPLVASGATAPPKVVFIGDQFTYNWATTPGAFPSNWINQGWNKASATITPNCFETCQGGTSEATEARFQTDVINLHPAIVHIMVGSDDADSDDDASVPYIYPDFLNALQTMIQMAKAANIQVILGIESNLWSSEGGQNFEPMNSLVATLGAQNNIPVINYGNALCSCVASTGATGIGQNFATLAPYMATIPGTSAEAPTAAGYELMTQMAAAVINTFNLKLSGGYLNDVQQENGRVGAAQPIVNVNTVSSQAVIQFTPYGQYSGLAAAQPKLNSDYAGATGTWASSNPLVMYVSQTGLAWAITSGTAIITYTSPAGVKFSEWIMYVN